MSYKYPKTYHQAKDSLTHSEVGYDMQEVDSICIKIVLSIW